MLLRSMKADFMALGRAHDPKRVYQHVETEDFRAPLNVADELLRDVTKSSSANPCSGDSKGDGAEART